MNFSITFLKQLQQLLHGEKINHGEFHGSSGKILKLFLSDEVLDYTTVGVHRKKIFCSNPAGLQNYLHNKYGITSLEDYILLKENEEVDRSTSTRVTSNSKNKEGKIFQGFFVNTYAEVTGILSGKEIQLKSVVGVYQFIHDYNNFSIPEDVTVVIVEGYQNFRDIDRQRYLFEGIKPIFIWRYQNMKTIIAWLNTNTNALLHFGDFDPAGLKIYITEFRNKLDLGRCRFFYPHNLELLVRQYGNRALYDDQIDHVKNIDFSLYPEIKTPWEIIRKYKKGLEQEILIGDAGKL